MHKKTHYIYTALILLICSVIHADDKGNLKKIIEKYSELSSDFNTREISVPSLLKKINHKNIILIDIRDKEEQAVSVLPGSITQQDFLKNPQKYKNKILVAYCTIGYRSGKFCEKYKKWDILNLEGGILAWSHFKGKFYRNGKETKEVHVYSKNWNFLHSNYKASYK